MIVEYVSAKGHQVFQQLDNFRREPTIKLEVTSCQNLLFVSADIALKKSPLNGRRTLDPEIQPEVDGRYT